MTKDDQQTLYEAIDSLADARAFLAVVDYQRNKEEVEATDPRFDSAINRVTEAQGRLRQAIGLISN